MVELPATRPARPWRPSPLLAASGLVHLAGLVALALAPERWPWLLGALAANNLLLAVTGILPRCALLGPNLRRLPPRPDAPRVHLTFDDGPDPEVTPRVLDLLEAHGARASFFLIGERAARHGDVVRNIVRRGHRVENHTHRHAYTFGFWGPRRLRRDLKEAQELLTALAGRPPAYLRAPAGIRSLWLEPALCRLGLQLASWTRRGYDTTDGNAARVLTRLERGIGDGAVLLLHDGRSARTESGEPVVLAMLPKLLERLEAEGYRVEALPAPP